MIVAPHGYSVVSRASEVNGYNIYAFRANCFTDGISLKAGFMPMARPRYDSRNGAYTECWRAIAGAGIALMPAKYAHQYAVTSSGVVSLAEKWRWLNTKQCGGAGR